MMTVDFYTDHFIPLIKEAASKGVTMNQDRFVEWVMKDRNRAAKYNGIRWDVGEFTPEEWFDVVKEATELD